MMTFEPILDGGDLNAALALLAEGFPERSKAFWTTGLQRAAGTARRSGVPLGQILVVKGQPSGVLLTFGSRRIDRTTPVVNLSSWYVKAPSRFLAPGMLKTVTTPAATYTDLTPSPQVGRLSRSLGFSDMMIATAVVPLMAAAPMQGAGHTLVPWRESALPESLSQMAEEHCALGCYAYGVRSATGDALVIVRRINYFRLPAAEVIYAPRQILRAAAGPLARALLRRGMATLIYDCRDKSDSMPFAILRRSKNQRLIKGGALSDVIDYAWSELPLLNP